MMPYENSFEFAAMMSEAEDDNDFVTLIDGIDVIYEFFSHGFAKQFNVTTITYFVNQDNKLSITSDGNVSTLNNVITKLGKLSNKTVFPCNNGEYSVTMSPDNFAKTIKQFKIALY